jgi:hypothetical protein
MTCPVCHYNALDCSCEAASEILDNLYEHDVLEYQARINAYGAIQIQDE